MDSLGPLTFRADEDTANPNMVNGKQLLFNMTIIALSLIVKGLWSAVRSNGNFHMLYMMSSLLYIIVIYHL